jgi:hypothetical protein
MTHNVCKSFFPYPLLYGPCIICVYFMSNFFVLSLQYFEKVFACCFVAMFLCCFYFVVVAFICMFVSLWLIPHPVVAITNVRIHGICVFVRASAVCKVHGLTLLLRIGTVWRCGDGLFFEVPPLENDALLTTLLLLLENVLQTVDYFETSSLGAPCSWLEKPRSRMGRDLNWILCSAWKKWISGTPLKHPPYSPDLALCEFCAFPTMKRELWGKKFRSYKRPAARLREVAGEL